MKNSLFKPFLMALPVTGCLLIAAWPGFFEVAWPGYRNTLLLLGLWLLLTAGFTWSWEKALKARWQQQTRSQKTGFLGFTAAFVLLLVVMVPLNFDHYFNRLLPTHTLQILPIGQETDQVDLLAFNVEWGQLPAGKINLPHTWQGRPGNQAVLAFNPEASSHLVEVIWDSGEKQTLDLASGVTKAGILAIKSFSKPSYHQFLFTLASLIAWFGLIFWFTLLLLAFTPRQVSFKAVKFSWLVWPMLIVWTVYLLTFWPGLSSYDTMQQWGEAQTRIFTDAHPALHTMFIALVSHFFPTPAAIAFLQILVLASVTAWGLVELNARGLPAWAAWALAVGFAIFPIHSLMVITVWKDILYGAAIFAFVIQFIKIVFSNGEWLSQKKNLAGLLLVGFSATFLRHNGFPIIAASLLVLILFYRQHWQKVLAVILLLTAITLGIRGPFYDWMQVKQYPGFVNILMFDHIGAHLKAGTPLETADRDYLNQLIPLEKWPYVCWNSEIRNMDGPIPFDSFAVRDPRPIQIAIKLFLKAPLVNVRHSLCAGGLVWRMYPGYSIYAFPMLNRKYMVMPNDYGITANPILPSLTPLLPIISPDHPLFWRPAFYSLVLLFITSTLVLRSQSPKIFLVLTPLVIQSGVILLINYANDFRYLFSTELSAFIFIGLLFLPWSSLIQANQSHHPTH